MPQNEMAGSITYGQKKYLMRLVDEREAHDATWFDDLKHQRVDFDDLSAADASEYIEELTSKDETQVTANTEESGDDAPPRTPRAASPEQLKYLHDLVEGKQLAIDGQIDVDQFFARLSAPSASKLIDVFKYIPRLEGSSPT